MISMPHQSIDIWRPNSTTLRNRGRTRRSWQNIQKKCGTEIAHWRRTLNITFLLPYLATNVIYLLLDVDCLRTRFQKTIDFPLEVHKFILWQLPECLRKFCASPSSCHLSQNCCKDSSIAVNDPCQIQCFWCSFFKTVYLQKKIGPEFPPTTKGTTDRWLMSIEHWYLVLKQPNSGSDRSTNVPSENKASEETFIFRQLGGLCQIESIQSNGKSLKISRPFCNRRKNKACGGVQTIPKSSRRVGHQIVYANRGAHHLWTHPFSVQRNHVLKPQICAVRRYFHPQRTHVDIARDGWLSSDG